MCKASIFANSTVPAEVGQTYGIQETNHRLGALVPEGMTAAECVACIRGVQVLTLTDISPAMQREYGIGPTEIVTFHEMEGDNTHAVHDLVELEDGTRVSLVEFAHPDTRAYVGVREVVPITLVKISPVEGVGRRAGVREVVLATAVLVIALGGLSIFT